MGELETFQKSLEEFLTRSASFLQTGDQRGEIFYSGFMMCLLCCLSCYYQIESEPESGLGRPDVVLIPKAAHNKDQAMVIEYKVSQDASDLPVPGRSRFTTDRGKGLCHSRYGTRSCQEGVANLFSLLRQGRGHEASGSDVLACFWARRSGCFWELVENLHSVPEPSHQLSGL